MFSIRIPKSRLVEAACRSDFLSFFQSFFHVLEPGSTLNMNWHHEAIAHHLELVRRGLIKRLIIAAPPRTLKSLMASVAFPAYVLGCDPAARVIGISHGADLQLKFNNDRRTLINSPHYRRLFPAVELSRNTESEFHTTQGGYCYAKSAESGVTGFGDGILIIDDFQKPQDMLSEARRTSTNSLYYSTIASRIDNQHSGAIVVVGQRLHPDDLIGTLLRSAEPWTVLCLPAIAEKEEPIPIGPDVVMCARLASCCIHSNCRAGILNRFVSKIAKFISHSTNRVLFRRAASSSKETTSSIVMNCRHEAQRPHICKLGILRESLVRRTHARLASIFLFAKINISL